MTVYLDTSAAVKLVLDEAESAALPPVLGAHRNAIVSSYLLRAELHCAAGRRPEVVAVEDVEALLATVELVDVDRSDLLGAAAVPGRLRASDAIHLATALRVGADTIVSYDAELNAAAEAAGLTVLSPA